MGKLLGIATITALSVPAFAQVVLDQPPPTAINATAVVVALIGAATTIIGTVATAIINKYVKDAKAAAVLSNAVTNSLGAIKNAEEAHLATSPITLAIPGVTPAVATGVQYVLDHAGDEAARFGITPEAIVDKINAKIGIAKGPPTGQPPALIP